MADLKISQLTGAATPLAGTEVLPIVQSATTKKVAVSDLTAGRSVNLGSGSVVGAGGTTNVATAFYINGTNNAANGASFVGQRNGSNAWVIGDTAGSLGSGTGLINYIYGANSYYVYCNNFKLLEVNGSTGDTVFYNGNLSQGTAAKGVNFTANTPAAGMTSQLLNWYEEGTWTPAQGGGLTVVGAFSSTGRYTRIGRQVTVSGTVTGATSVAVTAAGIVTTNLPFTVVTAGHGNATNAAVNASAAVICTTTNVTSANAIAATGTITFSATYFV